MRNNEAIAIGVLTIVVLVGYALELAQIEIYKTSKLTVCSPQSISESFVWFLFFLHSTEHR
jgi:hypothetical protein